MRLITAKGFGPIRIVLLGGLLALGATQAVAATATALGDCPVDRNTKIRLPNGVFSCDCKAVDLSKPQQVFGTDVYAKSSSDICTAAVHAGVLQPDTAAGVTFEVIDSPLIFRGTTRNKVTTGVSDKDWGAFQFDIGKVAAAPGSIADLGDCPVDRNTKIRLSKGTYSCSCPPAGGGRVIGSGVYDISESDICTAAVHDGLRKNDAAANVAFEVIAPPASYISREQNGITSDSAGGKLSWGAFQFVKSAQ